MHDLPAHDLLHDSQSAELSFSQFPIPSGQETQALRKDEKYVCSGQLDM